MTSGVFEVCHAAAHFGDSIVFGIVQNDLDRERLEM